MSEVEKIRQKALPIDTKGTKVVYLSDVLPLAERLDNIKKLLEKRPKGFTVDQPNPYDPKFKVLKNDYEAWIELLECELK